MKYIDEYRDLRCGRTLKKNKQSSDEIAGTVTIMEICVVTHTQSDIWHSNFCPLTSIISGRAVPFV